MNNPILCSPVKNVWTKIATNIVGGCITVKKGQPANYIIDYRITGSPAPANMNTSINLQHVQTDLEFEVILGGGADIWCYCIIDNGSLILWDVMLFEG